jgi:hypothetical protein
LRNQKCNTVPPVLIPLAAKITKNEIPIKRLDIEIDWNWRAKIVYY